MENKVIQLALFSLKAKAVISAWNSFILESMRDITRICLNKKTNKMRKFVFCANLQLAKNFLPDNIRVV